jgi:hypothetical protein
MHTISAKDLEGSYGGSDMASSLIEKFGMARSDSMELKNDPRFFSDNVINYRLSAFGSLAVVSGLMVGSAMSDIMDMDKNMDLTRWVGVLQFISFIMLCFVLGFNMIATYVGVAQPYHTMRLMTSGPTGFEAAASYYLNRNIVTWRHFAIRYMLISLPLYIVQMGLRLVVKFDRGNKDSPDQPVDAAFDDDMKGIFFGSLLSLIGICLLCIHWTHFAVFRERYQTMCIPPALSTFVQNMANPGMQTTVNPRWSPHLDV